MDFFDKLILPQSEYNITLLRYILDLTLVILVPYLSFVFGATVYSYLLNKRGTCVKNNNMVKLSRDIIDMATYSKSLPLALGIVPLLSTAFGYAQLLHGSGNSVASYVLLSLVAFIIAITLLYVNKLAFHFKDILNTKVTEEDEEVSSYREKVYEIFSSSGLFGILFLLLSVYMLSGSIQTAAQMDKLGNNSTDMLLFFSMDTITFFLQFVAVALGGSALFVYFLFFKSDSKYAKLPEDYKNFVRSFTLRAGLIFMLASPAFVFLNMLTKSDIALSSWYFILLIGVFFIILILINLAYQMLKDNNTKYVTSVAVLLFIMMPLLITKEQFAFSVATKPHYYELAKQYEEYHKELEAKFGSVVVEINGEDIYNNICSACHQFDQNMTGPAYKSVLPKYGDDVMKLSGFILNPVKVDPNFTAMPNQGLKPNEAKAVAEFLIKTYNEKYKK